MGRILGAPLSLEGVNVNSTWPYLVVLSLALWFLGLCLWSWSQKPAPSQTRGEASEFGLRTTRPDPALPSPQSIQQDSDRVSALPMPSEALTAKYSPLIYPDMALSPLGQSSLLVSLYAARSGTPDQVIPMPELGSISAWKAKNWPVN